MSTERMNTKRYSRNKHSKYTQILYAKSARDKKNNYLGHPSPRKIKRITNADMYSSRQ